MSWTTPTSVPSRERRTVARTRSPGIVNGIVIV
jgi:hypothetical protein